jgi:hypothetical protein
LVAADDCPAALQCAIAIAGKGANDKAIRKIARKWPRLPHNTQKHKKAAGPEA